MSLSTNREIKFKAFIKWAKIILEVETIDFERKRIYCKTEKEKPNPCDFYNFDDVILMQYADIKDKNGVEIYEGYILKTNKNIFKIEWSKQDFCFIFWVETLQEYMSLPFLIGLKDFEVIGNIYENPELLKG